MEGSSPECHINERIRRQNEDQQLRRPCDVMINETSPRRLVHLRIDLAIDSPEQEAFENVKPYQKVVDEDNANDQGAKRGQSRDRFQRHLGNMRSFRDGNRGVTISGYEEVLHDRIEAPGDLVVQVERLEDVEGVKERRQAIKQI